MVVKGNVMYQYMHHEKSDDFETKKVMTTMTMMMILRIMLIMTILMMIMAIVNFDGSHNKPRRVCSKWGSASCWLFGPPSSYHHHDLMIIRITMTTMITMMMIVMILMRESFLLFVWTTDQSSSSWSCSSGMGRAAHIFLGWGEDKNQRGKNL